MNPIPERYARYYLEAAPSLSVLVFGNAVLSLVGLRFYVDRGLAEVSTFLWPLFADSPTATALATLSFATLLPNLGRGVERAPANLPLAYLHTVAFVWLVKYGLWTVLALNLGFSAYFPDPFGYFGVVLSHAGFVALAYLIPRYGTTTRGALATALVLSLLNDLVDYGFGLHPPLRYEPGLALPILTVALSVVAVGLAWAAFPTRGTRRHQNID
ncbi:DUF1405 domain-containing protein [Salinirubellus sp. GCM10025818]|uniref:DUF1405 domain-containing protein n=1 Tax=Salinirubellus TaxID=2162630 RepID=UPI003615DA9C